MNKDLPTQTYLFPDLNGHVSGPGLTPIPDDMPRADDSRPWILSEHIEEIKKYLDENLEDSQINDILFFLRAHAMRKRSRAERELSPADGLRFAALEFFFRYVEAGPLQIRGIPGPRKFGELARLTKIVLSVNAYKKV